MSPAANTVSPAWSPQAPPSITLCRGWLEPGRHVWSPFVVKLEARLRFGGVGYTTDVGSPRHAPKGKIPYIECRSQPSPSEGEGASGQDQGRVVTISDSSLIAKSLTEAGLLSDLNAALSPESKALDMGLRAMLEDKLYFYHTKERWIDNYYAMRDYALWNIPYPVRVLVGILVFRKQAAMLQGQGTGRFTDEELTRFKTEIWAAIAELLQASKTRASSRGSKAEEEPFWVLGGDGPTEADTTLFGFIVSVLVSTAGPGSRKVVGGFPVLSEYAGRIHDRYFPDYEKWESG